MRLALLPGFLCLLDCAAAQMAGLRHAAFAEMPAQVDSNSPAFWRNGQLHIVNSTGVPAISRGPDQFNQSGTEEVQVGGRLPMWIEAAWVDADGTVYAWYHHEPGNVCAREPLTAPQIGAAVSYDGGSTFHDLGIVLASGDPVDCSAKNGFFAGGHGDFSVIADRERAYFYFLFTNYGGEVGGQGVAIARMALEDRDNPAGAVWKYFDRGWTEPGIGGRVTPVFRTAVSWQQAETDSLWGPSIHWNTFLESYVVLLSRACCRPKWPQEGIYISFNPDLSDPAGWTVPERILPAPGGYYPQVLGTRPGETDTVAGEVARLYVQGRSWWEIVFRKTDPNGPDPEPER